MKKKSTFQERQESMNKQLTKSTGMMGYATLAIAIFAGVTAIITIIDNVFYYYREGAPWNELVVLALIYISIMVLALMVVTGFGIWVFRFIKIK